MNHKLTNPIYPSRIETLQLPVVTTQAVQPQATPWELFFTGLPYFLLPFMVFVMLGTMISGMAKGFK